MAVLAPITTTSEDRDYSRFSAYADTQGLIRFTGENAQNSISTLPLEPPRTDTLANQNEMPSALGREFAYNDFSHGQGQASFHKRSSDPAKVLHSEGFDISEIGVLTHLRDTVANAAAFSGATGKTCKAQGYIFVTDGQGIKRFSTVSGAATAIDPHNGEAATTVYDITAEGDTIYAALGTNGIHLSTDAGATWSHHNDAQAILVAFLKERLIAATARLLYEITASGVAPSPKTTLKTGWTFTDLGETGQFVYASAIYEDGGQSRVYHYGLDSSLAFTEQGSSVLPNDDLCYSVTGYLGMVLLGCGRVNSSGGRDALVYKAVPDSSGFLPIQLVADSTGAGASDFSVKAITVKGRRFLFGWSLGSGAPFGARSGIAVYDPALDAFAHHLAIASGNVTSIEVFDGRLVMVSGAIYYEDLSNYVAEATLISSTADFNNPGPKNWDRTRITHKALPTGASVDLQYSLRSPEEGVWSAIDTSNIPGATEAVFRHSNVEGARWTLKIISSATSDASDAPQIESFSTRSNQSVDQAEYRIIRTFILADRLTLNRREVRQDPRDVRDYIEGKYREWFDYFEADYPLGFYVRLSDYSIIEPSDTAYQLAGGDVPEDFYLIQVVLEGTKN